MSTQAELDPDPGLPEHTASEPLAAPGAAAPLLRMEKLLEEIRGALDAEARAEQHVEFSWLRLVGAIVQVFAIGMFALALVDWLFQSQTAGVAGTLVKLSFATVLQLGALSAFVAAGGKS